MQEFNDDVPGHNNSPAEVESDKGTRRERKLKKHWWLENDSEQDFVQPKVAIEYYDIEDVEDDTVTNNEHKSSTKNSDDDIDISKFWDPDPNVLEKSAKSEESSSRENELMMSNEDEMNEQKQEQKEEQTENTISLENIENDTTQCARDVSKLDNLDQKISPSLNHLKPSQPEMSHTMKDQRPVEFRNPYSLPPVTNSPRKSDLILLDHNKAIELKPIKFTKPKSQLEDLLVAVTGDSVVRRSNACGAIKLFASKKKNQASLARVEGLLDALVFAAQKPIPQTGEEVLNALNARTRAVTSILLLSESKENRIVVFETEGLPECLLKVIDEDTGEARFNACSTLAILARSDCIRNKIANVDSMIRVLSFVVRGLCDKNGIILKDFPQEKSHAISNIDITSEEKKDKLKKIDSSNESQDTPYDSDCDSNDDDSISSQESNEFGQVPNPPRPNNNNNQVQDKKFQDYLSMARLHACAALHHLSKRCSVSPLLCSNDYLIRNLVAVTDETENAVHTKCLEILCQLTRFPANNMLLSKRPELIKALTKCGKSKIPEDRMWCMRTIQNLSTDSSSKIILAVSSVLEVLSASAMKTEVEEQFAAVGALLNLSTEPGAIIPLTNTKSVVATLVHLAHTPISSPEICQMACEALTTIGLWFQTLATAGTVPEGIDSTPLPTHVTTGYMRH